MKDKNATLKNALRTAFLAALIAVISQLAFPLPSGVPITLQVFAVGFCAYFAGLKISVASLAVYVVLGAVGVPVFAGFRGGIAYVIGPTGGFILGFFALCIFCASAKGKSKRLCFALSAVGLLLLHIIGALHFSLVSGTDFVSALIAVSLPYLPKDAVLLAFAFFCSKKASSALKCF